MNVPVDFGESNKDFGRKYLNIVIVVFYFPNYTCIAREFPLLFSWHIV